MPRTQGSTVWDSVDLEESQVDAPRIAYLQDDLQQVLQERAGLLDDIGQLMNEVLGEPEEGRGALDGATLAPALLPLGA